MPETSDEALGVEAPAEQASVTVEQPGREQARFGGVASAAENLTFEQIARKNQYDIRGEISAEASAIIEAVRARARGEMHTAELDKGADSPAAAAPPPPPPPPSYSLEQWQTPIRTQPYAECVTQAFLGALEARYKRDCLQNIYPFADEFYCSELKQGADLELSKAYMGFVTQGRSSARNYSVHHENGSPVRYYAENDIGNYCDGSQDSYSMPPNGLVTNTAEAVRLPLQRHVPQFGIEQPCPQPLACTTMSMQHLMAVQSEANDEFFFRGCHQPSEIQEGLDDFYFDPTVIPPEARAASAQYGAASIKLISAPTPALIESHISSNREVVVGLDFQGLDCGVTANVVHCTFDPNNPVNTGVGHAMLAIAYDQVSREVLFKNSWGPNRFPRMWVPYDFITQRASDATVIEQIAAPDSARRDQAMGRWSLRASDGTPTALLSIRRTREGADAIYGTGFELDTSVFERSALKARARWGSLRFYDSASQSYSAQSYRLLGETLPDGRQMLHVGQAVSGNGGDPVGASLPIQQTLGVISFESDGVMSVGTYRARRDFRARATANWTGTWSLLPQGASTPDTLVISSVAEVHNADGTLNASGTYSIAGQSPSSIVAKISEDGRRVRFSKSMPCSGFACVRMVRDVDLVHLRGKFGNELRDVAHPTRSTITTHSVLSVPSSLTPIESGERKQRMAVVLAGDFDSDSKLDDVAVWRPASGNWNGKRTDKTRIFQGVQWGAPEDIPLVGSADNDGKRNDLVVWRPSTGMWNAKRTDGSVIFTNIQWGEPTDVPLLADINHDGIDELVAWRPSTGKFLFWDRVQNVQLVPGGLALGTSGDKPFVGDFDWDGYKDDFAVWTPSTGIWAAKRTNGLPIFSNIQWGDPTDIPFVGDFDADGFEDDLMVYRGWEGKWYAKRWHDGASTPLLVDRNWGQAGDVPVVGDFDSDGKVDDLAVWRPFLGEFWIEEGERLVPLGFAW